MRGAQQNSLTRDIVVGCILVAVILGIEWLADRFFDAIPDVVYSIVLVGFILAWVFRLFRKFRDW